ncbi:hypothetical protein ACTMU2_18130 [Cupriavidus basilensis]
MSTESYRGYTIRGFARPLVDGMFEASGAVEQGRQVVEASDPLGYHPTFDRAVAEGLKWARDWVDVHS